MASGQWSEKTIRTTGHGPLTTMNNERNAFKAGLFIIISIVLIVAVVVAIKGVERFVEPVQTMLVTFTLADDIGGLAEGDEVRVGGYKVGVVREIDLRVDATGAASIQVAFTMPQRFTVHKNARIAVQGTLTGVSWLNFEYLGSGEVLAAGEALTGKPSAMSNLFAAVGELAPEIKTAVTDIKTNTLPRVNSTLDTFKGTGESATALFTQVRGQVDPVVGKYNSVADSAKVALDNVGAVFGDTRADFRTSVANVRDATETVKTRLPGLFDHADALLAKVTTAVDDAGIALKDVQKVAANTRDVSVTVRQIVNQNRGRLDAMIASLKTTGDNLKNASAEIRRSPWRLLYKPGPGEMANLNLYDSARQFADGANDLSDASKALRDALSDPDVDPVMVQRLVEKLDTSFSNFNEVEKVLWEQVQQ